MINSFYVIALSNEGDYFQETDVKDTWRSTLNLNEATRFNSEGEAQETLIDYGIRMMWKEANIKLLKGDF